MNTYQNKHRELAQVVKNKGLGTWEEMREYAYPFAKYDNWTLRDLDRAWELSQK